MDSAFDEPDILERDLDLYCFGSDGVCQIGPPSQQCATHMPTPYSQDHEVSLLVPPTLACNNLYERIRGTFASDVDLCNRSISLQYLRRYSISLQYCFLCCNRWAGFWLVFRNCEFLVCKRWRMRLASVMLEF